MESDHSRKPESNNRLQQMGRPLLISLKMKSLPAGPLLNLDVSAAAEGQDSRRVGE
jgi:hypothetical protein